MDGKDHDKSWSHATLTRFSDNLCETYASHDIMELNTCMPVAENSPDYVKWVLDMDQRMLSRLDFATDDSCAADSELEGNRADFALPEKDAESKCMAPDDVSQMYTITKPPKDVDIKTYGTNSGCDADEFAFADEVMTGECTAQEVPTLGTQYRTYEWTGVGI